MFGLALWKSSDFFNLLSGTWIEIGGFVVLRFSAEFFYLFSNILDVSSFLLEKKFLIKGEMLSQFFDNVSKYDWLVLGWLILDLLAKFFTFDWLVTELLKLELVLETVLENELFAVDWQNFTFFLAKLFDITWCVTGALSFKSTGEQVFEGGGIWFISNAVPVTIFSEFSCK